MTAAPGYVYVLALSNGTVKVGRSLDAEKRLNTHRLNARTLGLSIADSWTSPLHLEWQANEDTLKEIAADLGGIPQSRETFNGIEFAAMVARARELTFTTPVPSPVKAPEPHPVAAMPARKALAGRDAITGETLAFFSLMGRAIRMEDEGFAAWWRQRHPDLAEASDLALWFEDVVCEIRGEAA